MRRLLVAFLIGLTTANFAQTNITENILSPNGQGVSLGKSKASPAIERLLKERNLKYTICEDGDFKLSFGLDDGRSQVVFISSEIRDVDGYKTIHIHSPAYRGKLTKPMLKDLLTDSVKVGAWLVEKENSSGKDIALFVAKISADVMADDLETCLRLVAQKADEKEELWTDVDEW